MKQVHPSPTSRVLLPRAAALAAALALSAGTGLRAQTPAYKVVEVKDGATISGQMKFSGTPPVIKLKVEKDVKVCCPGCTERDSPRLIVGPSAGVKDAVVFLLNVTSGKAFPKEPPVLDQVECVYTPHIVIAKKGDKLKIRNSDDIFHTTHGFLKDADIFNVPTPTKDSEVMKPLRQAGLARVQCDAGHIWMSAYIFIVNHPYYAVTDAEGKFVLKDVPSGEYTLRAWHEGWEVKDVEQEGGKVVRYQFADDVATDLPVSIVAGEKRVVNFTLAEKGKLSAVK